MKRKNKTTELFRRLCIACICSAFFSWLTSCSAGNPPASGKSEKLVVFAAASLTESFDRLADEFEKKENGEVEVILNYAGSQALRASIESGAKADIFVSADAKNMETLVKEGYVDKYEIVAKNRLTVVLNKKSAFDVKALKDLGAEGLKLAIADESVPAGAYWKQALEKAADSGELTAADLKAIDDAVATKELNVKDVLSKVLLGEADAGIVYGTDAAAAGSERIREIRLPELFGLNAVYPAAVLKASGNKKAAKQFYDYLFTKASKDMLKEFGFLVE